MAFHSVRYSPPGGGAVVHSPPVQLVQVPMQAVVHPQQVVQQQPVVMQQQQLVQPQQAMFQPQPMSPSAGHLRSVSPARVDAYQSPQPTPTLYTQPTQVYVQQQQQQQPQPQPQQLVWSPNQSRVVRSLTTPDVHGALATPPGIQGVMLHPNPVPPTEPVFNQSNPPPQERGRSSVPRKSAEKKPDPIVQPPSWTPDDEDEIVIEKEDGKGIGLIVDNMTLTGVRPGSPAHASGAENFIGRKLTEIDYEPVATGRDIAERSKSPERVMSIKFEKKDQSPQRDASSRIISPAAMFPDSSSNSSFDENIDPRNGLQVVKIPDSKKSKFIGLCNPSRPGGEAVLYFCEDINKVSSGTAFTQSLRTILINDSVMYVCEPKKGHINRTIPLKVFSQVSIGTDDTKIGFHAQRDATPPQHDLLLDCLDTHQRERILHVIRVLFFWLSNGQQQLREHAYPKLTKKLFNLKKSSEWSQKSQRAMQYTTRESLKNFSSIRSQSLASKRS